MRYGVIEFIVLENLVGLGYHVLWDSDPFASGKVFEIKPKMVSAERVRERKRGPTIVDYICNNWLDLLLSQLEIWMDTK